MQQPRVLNNQYSIFDEALLGKGSTGDVYLGCVNGNPAQKVAIKSINLHEINNEVTRYLLSCEIAALSNLGKLQNTQHENVVRLLEIIIVENRIYLVMELLEGGTLASYISKHPNGLPEEEALMILKQILEGYKRIKDKNVVHRDLKPDNILFKGANRNEKKIAIIDFGYCEMKEVPNKPQLFYNVGSPKYMSPQAYKQNKYSQKSDIWAIGVILYEMLLGKTCDSGMNMQSYLEMLQTKGIPLPAKLKNFHKHLLTLMLAYNHQTRISCDQVLRILNLQQNSGPIQQVPMQNKLGNGYLRATIETNTFQRPNRNNPVFHSACLPSQIVPITGNRYQTPLQIMQLPRSQSRLSEPNENKIREAQGIIRNSGIFFHNQQKAPKRVFIHQNRTKIENAQLNSVKQILNRRQATNNPILKTDNAAHFSKESMPYFSQKSVVQNLEQQPLHIERPAMNQIFNQQKVKINMPSQPRSSNLVATPKQNVTFAQYIHQSSQPTQIFLSSNETPKSHANYFEIARIKESQTSQVNAKTVPEEIRFLEMHSFTEPSQYRRQPDYNMRPTLPQNKVRVLPISQAQVNRDLTQARHPYPDLTQNLPSHQNLNRTPHNEVHQIGTHRPEITQTKLPIQSVNSDFDSRKAPRPSQEIEFNQPSTPHNSNRLQGFNQKKDDNSEKLVANKASGKPFQMVREVINLKPQVSAIRNIGNKINYVKLHPQTKPQSFLMPSAVK